LQGARGIGSGAARAGAKIRRNRLAQPLRESRCAAGSVPCCPEEGQIPACHGNRLPAAAFYVTLVALGLFLALAEIAAGVRRLAEAKE
jgi:hypothetical protein